MKTYAEQEIKDMVTPEIIKKMVEIAEGFSIEDDLIFISYRICDAYYDDDEILDDGISFPLLIHRCVEGWNKKQDFRINGISTINESLCLALENRDYEIFYFKNYQPENLTALECALLHCLVEVLKEGV